MSSHKLLLWRLHLPCQGWGAFENGPLDMGHWSQHVNLATFILRLGLYGPWSLVPALVQLTSLKHSLRPIEAGRQGKRRRSTKLTGRLSKKWTKTSYKKYVGSERAESTSGIRVPMLFLVRLGSNTISHRLRSIYLASILRRCFFQRRSLHTGVVVGKFEQGNPTGHITNLEIRRSTIYIELHENS